MIGPPPQQQQALPGGAATAAARRLPAVAGALVLRAARAGGSLAAALAGGVWAVDALLLPLLASAPGCGRGGEQTEETVAESEEEQCKGPEHSPSPRPGAQGRLTAAWLLYAGVGAAALRLALPGPRGGKGGAAAGLRTDLALSALLHSLHSWRSFLLQRRRRRDLAVDGERGDGAPWWLAPSAGTSATAALFSLTCTEIMYAWFYHPGNLPPSYERWLSRFAGTDGRLLELLRLIADGRVVYGVPSADERATAIGPEIARACGFVGAEAEALGDMARGPLPCVLVHGGRAEHCAPYAALTFLRTFRQAAALYLPVHAVASLLSWRAGPRPEPDGAPARRPAAAAAGPRASLWRLVRRVAGETLRSSAFLATYTTTVFASICAIRWVLCLLACACGSSAHTRRRSGPVCA
jgi:hypothetical protein